jgi:hypothetical protein
MGFEATGQSPFFFIYESKAIYRLTLCGSLLDWRCMKKARLTVQDVSNLTQLRKLDATSCSSRPATYKQSVVTTTGTFNDTLSTFEICFFRRIQDETGLHKINSRWEGLFIVHKVTGLGLYRLQYPNGQEIPNS